MKRAAILFSFLFLVAHVAAAQVDTEKTSKGDLKITPVTHASVQFEFGGKVIDVDPISMGPAGAVDWSKYPKADWIFITDIHGDHFDPKALDALKKGSTKFVAPPVVAEKLMGAMVMKNGETKEFDGIKVEAIPMYNLKRGPSEGKFFHDKGRGNAYIFNFGDKRVLLAGDTECVPELKAVKNIDIAFLPMNLPYTMPPEEAAACAKEFKPKVLYPYHYGDSNVSGVQELVGKDIQVRVRPMK
jgi:L-ascorbate metabolism protein UlaG (beta-lactamase superfamily)